MFKRETSMSLAEAIAKYQQGHSGMGGQCICINEIGIMAIQGSIDAEIFLSRVLLETTSEACKKMIHCYLSNMLPETLPQTKETLQQFAENPVNTELVEFNKQFKPNQY